MLVKTNFSSLTLRWWLLILQTNLVFGHTMDVELASDFA